MKGREHESIAKILAVIFGLIILISFIWDVPFLSAFVKYIGLFWFFIALILFVIGSILPDSDSEDMGSYIYFKQVFGIAYFFKGLEFLIAPLLKRRRGHRQSLHTLVGIILTSFALIVLLSFLANFFKLFEWRGVITAFVFLFLGQLLHLICDLQENWKITWI
jgi:membrane-bound metal-dependent hydrolase YbcI (DUF457 family)